MEKQVRGLGIRNFHFVPAVDSRELSIDQAISQGLYSDIESKRWHTSGLTVNEIACSLSHAECYRLIVEAGHDRAIVLEDDVLFRAARMRRLKEAHIPHWADIVFLNAFIWDHPPQGRQSQYIYGDESYHGSAAAYLITGETAKALFQHALPVVHAADGLVGRALAHSGPEPHPFRQKGCSLSLRGVIVHPELAINGSTDHYYRTSIRAR